MAWVVPDPDACPSEFGAAAGGRVDRKAGDIGRFFTGFPIGTLDVPCAVPRESMVTQAVCHSAPRCGAGSEATE